MGSRLSRTVWTLRAVESGGGDARKGAPAQTGLSSQLLGWTGPSRGAQEQTIDLELWMSALKTSCPPDDSEPTPALLLPMELLPLYLFNMKVFAGHLMPSVLQHF